MEKRTSLPNILHTSLLRVWNGDCEGFLTEKDRNRRYQPPVERLLTYGESDRIPPEEWPDYRELGIGPEHILELIQMATDEAFNMADSESAEVWAPLHAWRALGQLRAVEAVEPLLELFDRLEYDDWVHEELPLVFALMGPQPFLPSPPIWQSSGIRIRP